MERNIVVTTREVVKFGCNNFITSTHCNFEQSKFQKLGVYLREMMAHGS